MDKQRGIKVYGGMATHGRTHHAAVIDAAGRVLADLEVNANPEGYRQVLAWMRTYGSIVKVGVEGTGFYGAGVARFLTAAGVTVVEVDRPDRRARRRQGKSDPLDAISAARSALSGEASGTPKTRTGVVEAIRALRVARRGAVKARTAALNQLHGLIVSAPEPVKASVAGLTGAGLVGRCASFRVPAATARLTDPVVATKTAMRALGRRILALQADVQAADRQLEHMTRIAAPRTTALFGVGPEIAAQMLITAGDNPERLRSEAAFAHLCAAAPIPASSGRVDKHRLNRGGDRGANSALYMVVVTRIRAHRPTQSYVARRTAQGLSKTDIIRCLKRFVVREIFSAIRADFEAAQTT
jgi:transposase